MFSFLVTTTSFNMELHFTCLTPPTPHELAKDNEGKQLLNLFKSFERATKDGQDSSGYEHTILDILSQMAATYQSRGLFSNEESRAKHSSNIPAASKKRKRGGGSGSTGKIGKIASMLNLDGSNSSEEAYALSNLCRVLIPNNERGLIYTPEVVASSAIALDAICQHCIHQTGEKSMPELEMIGSIASQLLSGLSKVIKNLLDDDDDTDDAVIACCKCAKGVVIISNVKLSRNAASIASIQSVALDVLLQDESGSIEMSGIVDAAAGLIASLPLVGNSNGVAPVQLWSDAVLESTLQLSNAIRAFFPLAKKFRKGKSSPKVEGVEWIEHIRSNVTSQADRLITFLSRIKANISVLTKLLDMDGYHVSNMGNGVILPITALLEVTEQLMLFASVAETRFLATKSKLRDISVEGGLLSASSAVMVANSVKFLGYALFETICSTLTTSALPHGKQLMDLALSNLQSSSSLALKRVIDPSSSADKNNKKKWFHTSIMLRTKSIEAFTLVAQRLGSNTVVTQNSAVTKALAFIAGNLLEQMSNSDGKIEEFGDEHWGSEDQKAALVCACCDGLSAAISVFGGFMTIQNRELVESIASTAISNLGMKGTQGRFCNFSVVKASILRLGISCIVTPWPDGAASGLVQVLRQAASVLRFDRDSNVSITSYSAMGICNMAVTPRAPPLVIVTRLNDSDANTSAKHRQFFSRESLENGMEAAKEDILKSKIIEKEAEEKKKKKKDAEKSKMQKKEADKKNLKETSVVESYDVAEKESTTDNAIEAVQPPQVNQIVEGDLLEEKDEDADVDISDGGPNDKDTENKDEIDDESTQSSAQDFGGDGSDDDFPPIIDCAPDEEDD